MPGIENFATVLGSRVSRAQRWSGQTSTVKEYITTQATHHGYDNRMRSPVYRYRAREKVDLRTAHSFFELAHHIVLATRYRHGVFGVKEGEALIGYWRGVAKARGFAVDQASVLPDHVHLLIRISPKLSPKQTILSLLNNGQYFIGKHFPHSLIEAEIDQLWQPSAYVGTSGNLTTALLKAFLRTER